MCFVLHSVSGTTIARLPNLKEAERKIQKLEIKEVQ